MNIKRFKFQLIRTNLSHQRDYFKKSQIKAIFCIQYPAKCN